MKLPAHDDELLLLHNPRCSKSRAVKLLLEERGLAFEVREYLSEPLGTAELEELERRLERPLREWVRRGEGAWEEAGVQPNAEPAALRAAVAAHPVLMERPILVRGRSARVGRPPEGVLELLED